MADEFDMVDIVYGAVAPVAGDIPVYKGPSLTGETKDHITIRTLALHEQTAVNKGQVNVNVFIRHQEKDIPNRARMKSLVRSLRKCLHFAVELSLVKNGKRLKLRRRLSNRSNCRLNPTKVNIRSM